jgi:hypothetical protein
MVAAARLALLDIRSELNPEEDDRSRYFAKPGTAEWVAESARTSRSPTFPDRSQEFLSLTRQSHGHIAERL